MKKWNRLIGLLAFALFLGSCATIDDAKSSMKKTFPGRTDNTTTTK